MRIVSRKSKGREKCYYDLNEKQLKTVAAEKDLGVIIDNKLSFEAHIADKIKKANALAGMLRRSFTYLNVDMFKSLFTSIVRPHLEYGAPIWSPI